MPDTNEDQDYLDEDPGNDEDQNDEGPEDERGRLRRRFGRKREAPRKRLSELLEEFGSDPTRQRISVKDILIAMEGRAIGAMLLLFALPNVLPAPPGTSGILGLPLVYLAAQMMLGRLPWLPPFIANRSMTREDFQQTIARATPLIARAERMLKPRLSLFVKDHAQNIVGAFCLVLAIVLMLPIPFGNMLPAAAISLIALGLLEKDGVWVLAGLVIGAIGLFIVAGVVYAMMKAALFILLNAF